MKTFSWAMSEALFIPISLTSLYFIYEYLENGKRAYLLGSGIFIGLAMVTRYIGVALLPVFLIAILMNDKSSVVEKIRNGLLGLVIACFPLVAWYIRNNIVSNSGTGRKFGLNMPPLIEFEYFIKQVVGWIIPIEYTRYRMRLVIVAASLLVILVATILLLFGKKTKGSSVRKGLLIFLLYSIFYSLIVLSTIIFWVPSISMVDERIMVPLLVNLMILIVLTGIYILEKRNRVLTALFFLVYAYLVVYNSPQQQKNIQLMHLDGQGYASRGWQESPAIKDLKNIQSVIYTNDFQALYFMSGQNGCILPTKEIDLVSMRENISNKKGYVVFFGSHLPEFLPIGEITQGMTLLKEFPEIRNFQQLDTQR